MMRASAIKVLLLAALCLGWAALASAQSNTTYPLVLTSVSPTTGTVGDKLKLELTAQVPTDGRVDALMPDEEETTWTIEGKPVVSPAAAVSGNLKAEKYTYTIVPFATGRLTVPRVAFTYTAADGATSNTVLSEALWVDISSVLPATGEAALHDVPGPLPVPLPKSFIWYVAAAVAVLLLIIGFFIWRRYAKRLRNMLGGYLRPDELALKEISQLEEERLIEQKKVKEFYTRLADSLRHYVAAAYGIHATDLTSTEMLRELDDLAAAVPYSQSQNYKQAVARLTELLTEADLVKFARLVPEASQCRRAMQAGRDVVQLTRYRFVPEEEAAPQGSRPSNAGNPPPPPPLPGGEQ